MFTVFGVKKTSEERRKYLVNISLDKKEKVSWIEKEKYLETNIVWELQEVRSDWK